jgi:hypothetical protein
MGYYEEQQLVEEIKKVAKLRAILKRIYDKHKEKYCFETWEMKLIEKVLEEIK